jgi:hypothetical protein
MDWNILDTSDRSTFATSVAVCVQWSCLERQFEIFFGVVPELRDVKLLPFQAICMHDFGFFFGG